MMLETELVSYHAVSRYCERILGIDAPTSAGTPRDCAEAHARAAGMTIAEVRALIWTPGIRFASRFGVEIASNGHFAVAISQPTGVITTVLPPFAHHEQRLRVLTEKEFRRKARCTERRQKRRPSPTGATLRRPISEEE